MNWLKPLAAGEARKSGYDGDATGSANNGRSGSASLKGVACSFFRRTLFSKAAREANWFEHPSGKFTATAWRLRQWHAGGRVALSNRERGSVSVAPPCRAASIYRAAKSVHHISTVAGRRSVARAESTSKRMFAPGGSSERRGKLAPAEVSTVVLDQPISRSPW